MQRVIKPGLSCMYVSRRTHGGRYEQTIQFDKTGEKRVANSFFQSV